MARRGFKCRDIHLGSWLIVAVYPGTCPPRALEGVSTRPGQQPAKARVESTRPGHLTKKCTRCVHTAGPPNQEMHMACPHGRATNRPKLVAGPHGRATKPENACGMSRRPGHQIRKCMKRTHTPWPITEKCTRPGHYIEKCLWRVACPHGRATNRPKLVMSPHGRATKLETHMACPHGRATKLKNARGVSTRPGHHIGKCSWRVHTAGPTTGQSSC